ncbi:MAG: S9 family peptidase [Acidobacteria bacterium]|nr:S9 family peptidase [Acidobacteriota bacterium]
MKAHVLSPARVLRAALFVPLATLATLAPASVAVAASHSEVPPLVDREIFFGDPEISQARLSPDGKFIAFVKPLDGTRNIWVKKTGDPFTAATPITAETKRPVPAYFWSRDGKYILFVQDQGGDENFNVYAVDPAAKPAEGSKVPAARNITEAKGVRTIIYDVPKTNPDVIYVGLNDRDAAWHDLYEVTISTGARKKLRENTERLTGWVFDLTGKARLATRSADNGDTEFLTVTDAGFKKVYSCDVLESCGPVRFHKDGKRVYLDTNKGTDLGRLALLDPESGKEELVESDPQKRVDFGNAIFSDLTDELVGTTYEDDKTRFLWRNAQWKADYDFLKGKFPGREITPVSQTKDETLSLVVTSSDVEPGEVYLFDRKSRGLTLQYKVREKLPRAALSPMKPIRYKSSDGLEIPGYLTIPKGSSGKNLPVILFPHGGPWARDSWGYNPYAQFWSNRGYAVLSSNFRGSTGYGKKFLDAGNGQWGEKMQDDLTWGVKYLVAQGIADPKRVVIMGGSYGGYATLAGVAFTPDVYAAGVSLVGPSNLLTLLDSIPPYWESIRKLFHVRMGDPTKPEGKAKLVAQSPLTAAAKIKTPLLVVQGANDPRVKQAESDQIVIALRDRGFPVEYIVAPDEGHGFQRPVNNMAWIAAAEKFLAKHVGGKAQTTMTPEVEKRLAEITVDPKTVVLAKKAAAAGKDAPKLAGTLTAGSSKFAGLLQMGEQQMPMDISREIKAEGATFVVTESAVLPMGAMKDSTVLDKATLTVLKRSIQQGPATIEYEVKGGKIEGSTAMGGPAKPFSIDLDGPIFAEGAGTYEVVAALPLAAGYTASYRNVDVRTQKVKLVALEVEGDEKVTVKTGTFDTWRVALKGEDGTISRVWVTKDTKKPVKTFTKPAGSPATMATEAVQ